MPRDHWTPDAPLVAERDKLSAKVADLQDKLAASAARLQGLDTRIDGLPQRHNR
jgi:division protein CdvB (Snf7/Vps24/ESCRT-III family)